MGRRRVTRDWTREYKEKKQRKEQRRRNLTSKHVRIKRGSRVRLKRESVDPCIEFAWDSIIPTIKKELEENRDRIINSGQETLFGTVCGIASGNRKYNVEMELPDGTRLKAIFCERELAKV